jgi:hypothetical protein
LLKDTDTRKNKNLYITTDPKVYNQNVRAGDVDDVVAMFVALSDTVRNEYDKIYFIFVDDGKKRLEGFRKMTKDPKNYEIAYSSLKHLIDNKYSKYEVIHEDDFVCGNSNLIIEQNDVVLINSPIKNVGLIQKIIYQANPANIYMQGPYDGDNNWNVSDSCVKGILQNEKPGCPPCKAGHWNRTGISWLEHIRSNSEKKKTTSKITTKYIKKSDWDTYNNNTKMVHLRYMMYNQQLSFVSGVPGTGNLYAGFYCPGIENDGTFANGAFVDKGSKKEHMNAIWQMVIKTSCVKHHFKDQLENTLVELIDGEKNIKDCEFTDLASSRANPHNKKEDGSQNGPQTYKGNNLKGILSGLLNYEDVNEMKISPLFTDLQRFLNNTDVPELLDKEISLLNPDGKFLFHPDIAKMSGFGPALTTNDPCIAVVTMIFFYVCFKIIVHTCLVENSNAKNKTEEIVEMINMMLNEKTEKSPVSIKGIDQVPVIGIHITCKNTAYLEYGKIWDAVALSNLHKDSEPAEDTEDTASSSILQIINEGIKNIVEVEKYMANPSQAATAPASTLNPYAPSFIPQAAATAPASELNPYASPFIPDASARTQMHNKPGPPDYVRGV